MRRKLSVLLALTLLATSAFGLAGPATAHPVILGPGGGIGDAEWNRFGVTSSEFKEKNVGRILRNDQGQGEYAWRDVSGGTTTPTSDVRPVNSVITETRQVDLRQFRLTGTPTDLYVYVEFAGLTGLSGGAVPEVQIAIDDPNINTAGNTHFVANPLNTTNTTTALTPTLRTNWDYLVRTRFDDPQAGIDTIGKTNTTPPALYTAVNGVGAPTGDGVLSGNTNAIELRIPWTALGSASGAPRANLRFYVATLRADHAPSTADSAKGTAILDVVSRVTDGVAGDTAEDTARAITRDLGSGRKGLDYSFDVNFDAASGEPYSPVLITELSLRPATPPGSPVNAAQWVEISNVSGAALNISNYKVGDAGDPTSSEGMYSLSKVTSNVAASGSIVVTRSKASFESQYPDSLFPGISALYGNVYQAITTTVSTKTLLPYDGWGGEEFSLPVRLSETSTLRDQAVLLDGSDTIVDLVEYTLEGTDAAEWYPENVPVTVAASDTSTTPPDRAALPANTDFIRCPASRDTNNAPNDFIRADTKAQHTPLASACAVADLYTTVAGPGGVVVSATGNTTESYTVTYGNSRADAAGATLSVTLPRGMALAAAVSTPDIGQPTVGISADDRVLLTWSNVASNFGTQGTVNLTLTVPANTPVEPATSLEATFSVGAGNTEGNSLNNTSVLPITYSAQPFANVGISISNKSPLNEFFPGGKIVYAVSVNNAGSAQADNVTVEIDTPNFLTYKSNSRNYPTSFNGTKVTFTLGPVPAGAPSPVQFDVEFTVNPSAVVGTSVQATVTVRTTTTPETPTTDNVASSPAITVQARPEAPDVQLVKARKDSSVVKQGDLVTYVLTVSNVGKKPVTAGVITVIDDFPEAQLEYVDYQSAADVGVVATGAEVRFSLRGALDVGQSVTVNAVFRVKTGVPNNTQVRNLANVPLFAGEATDANNSSEAVLTVTPVTPATEYKVMLPLVVQQP